MRFGVKSLSDLLRLEFFMLFLVGISLFGLVIIFLYSFFQSDPQSNFALTFGIYTFIAIATLLTGLLIGFIFGIPRTTNTQIIEPGKTPENPTLITLAITDENKLYRDNSNLEKISDWLTTAIVTIALTNLNRVPEAFNQFSTYVGQALGNSTSGGILGSFILVGYSIDGFLISYLGTRRRAAVDFGKGMLEEEEIIQAIKDLISKSTSREVKDKAIHILARNIPVLSNYLKKQGVNADSESAELAIAETKDER